MNLCSLGLSGLAAQELGMHRFHEKDCIQGVSVPLSQWTILFCQNVVYSDHCRNRAGKKDIGQMHCLSVMMMNPHHPMTEALIQILTVTGLNLLHMGPHQKHLNQRGKCVKGTKRIITTKLHAIFRMNNYHQTDEDGQILKLLGTLFCKRHNQHQPLSKPLDYDTTATLSSSLLNPASSPAWLTSAIVSWNIVVKAS